MNIEQKYLFAKKRVKDLKGFYMHLFASLMVPPFLIFINLNLDPQFHWFWIALIAWFAGILVHWLNVFVFNRIAYSEKWRQKKINEMLSEDQIITSDFVNERYYIEAKKKAKEVKGFYAHFIVSLIAIPIIVYVNLTFVPGFNFFWFAAGGMLIAILLHWFGVFGLNQFGIGKNWEERKMNQFMNTK